MKVTKADPRTAKPGEYWLIWTATNSIVFRVDRVVDRVAEGGIYGDYSITPYTPSEMRKWDHSVLEGVGQLHSCEPWSGGWARGGWQLTAEWYHLELLLFNLCAGCDKKISDTDYLCKRCRSLIPDYLCGDCRG